MIYEEVFETLDVERGFDFDVIFHRAKRGLHDWVVSK